MILLEGLDYLSLTVRDLEASLKFYQENFDFEVTREYETEKAAVIELEGARFKLVEDPEFSGNEGNNTLFYCFSMDVDDFTEALADLENRGIQLLSGPHAEEGGEYLFIVDPDGYRIKLAYRE